MFKVKKWLLILVFCNVIVHSNTTNNYCKKDFSKYFKNFDGAFVLYDYNNQKYTRYNSVKCKTRYSPCSTFKIPNTLLALELEIITKNNSFMEWDGKERMLKSWNSNQNLKSAFTNSTVWYYQNLAVKIGKENYKTFLNKINYGNQDITSKVNKFWLSRSLKISPNEQVNFLKKIYSNNLPINPNHIDTLKTIMIMEENSLFNLRGKTGSGKTSSSNLGWFIGALELQDNTYLFASLIEGNDASGLKAKAITKNILKKIVSPFLNLK